MQTYKEDWMRHMAHVRNLSPAKHPVWESYRILVAKIGNMVSCISERNVVSRVIQLRLMCNAAARCAATGGCTHKLPRPSPPIWKMAETVLWGNFYHQARTLLSDHIQGMLRSVREGTIWNWETVFVVAAALFLYDAQCGGLNYKARCVHYMRSYIVLGYCDILGHPPPHREYVETPDPVYMACMCQDSLFVKDILAFLPNNLYREQEEVLSTIDVDYVLVRQLVLEDIQKYQYMVLKLAQTICTGMKLF
ncbi:ORF10 [Ranid herpesvirus 1]|uniref:ORF10 n=1 Tax=Ranid herpesvirus 1 TaxID=85655 RepID=Q14VU8_9VIRU|nr:ORF10 [Ranid herpesvirus 1]ABG25784.1 ORF10 [Ranid herpesvirus 1]